MSDPKDRPVIIDAATLDQGIGEPGQARSGPLLDIERFKQEYLFGVPMVSPLTGQEITDETLKQFLRKGVAEFETSVRIPVSPVHLLEKIDYERADDQMFGTKRLRRWPLISVLSLKAQWPGRVSGQEVPYPTSWIEADGDTGLIRIVPRSGSDVQADVNFISSLGYAGMTLGNVKSWPAMWHIEYTAGFPHDQVPDAVNDLIGVYAAIKFLSQMGPAIFPVNSYSIGIDGMSQGTSNSGPQWLAARLQDLAQQAETMKAQLRAHYGTDIFLQAW
jgi:hypothetical protein